MNILIFGGAGMLGTTLAQELKLRGHRVKTAGRSHCDVQVDFRYEHSADGFRPLVRGVDVVVNCVGILIERGEERFDAVHVAAPRALFEACAAEHVARVVQVSALGAGRGLGGQYMVSKEAAEECLKAAFAHSSSDWVIVRPSLIMNEGSRATRAFTGLSRLPVMGLPGFFKPGACRLAPLACSDVAVAIANIASNSKGLRRVVELCGQELSYREFLAQLRSAQGLGAALWLPIPLWLMHLVARVAEHLPQKFVSSDGLRVLKAGMTSAQSESRLWLRRAPAPISKMLGSSRRSKLSELTQQV